MHILLVPYNLSILLGFLGILVYNLKFRTKKNKPHLIILGLIFFVLCFESYAYYLHSQRQSTFTLYNICYIYLETLIFFCYFNIIAPSSTLKKYTKIFSFFLIAFGIVNTFTWQTLIEFQSYSFIMSSLGILFFCCLYLLEVIRYNYYSNVTLFAIPHFWNISALLMFYSTTFLLSISLTNIVSHLDPKFVTFLANLNQFFAGLMYIVLGFSFYLPKLFKTERAE